MREYYVMIRGVRFDWLLMSVYANTAKEARAEALKHVEPGESWYVKAGR